jgi:hypothetical protein
LSPSSMVAWIPRAGEFVRNENGLEPTASKTSYAVFAR